MQTADGEETPNQRCRPGQPSVGDVSRVDVLEGREIFQALDLVQFSRRAGAVQARATGPNLGCGPPMPLNKAAVTVEQEAPPPVPSAQDPPAQVPDVMSSRCQMPGARWRWGFPGLGVRTARTARTFSESPIRVRVSVEHVYFGTLLLFRPMSAGYVIHQVLMSHCNQHPDGPTASCWAV